jgi:uncharacterized protein
MEGEKGDLTKMGALGFVCGVIFSVGLNLSEMTNPKKILNFLDMFRGNWDPSLAFVMIGGIITYHIFFKWRGKGPILGGDFSIPNPHIIDLKLFIGQVLFGIGFGLSGLCVGPSIGSLLTGRPTMYIFIASLVCGSLIYQYFHVWRKK